MKTAKWNWWESVPSGEVKTLKKRIFQKFILASLMVLVLFSEYGWSDPVGTLSNHSQSIGFYSAGCLSKGVALSLRGQGFTVMRSSRNRYYGHPNLIAFIHRLGNYAANQGQQLLIGDLSQPQGGPMTYGHRSHQIGLDVDIWFYQEAAQRILSQSETEQLNMLSVVHAAAGDLNHKHWSPFYGNILKHAAQNPSVERIFVNPIIKGALCRRETEDRAWLRKIRPWWGHDAHFHVRLRCPEDSRQCVSQKLPPPGDGCQPDLKLWIKQIQQAVLNPSPTPPKSASKPTTLPTACTAILADKHS
jgi:penicillin-insensitive murein endopeptidase